MEVTIKINGINGSKEIRLNPETPLEHEYLPLIKEGEKYEVIKDLQTNKVTLKLLKTE